MTEGKVVVEITMSLDGFIAGPNDGVDTPLGVTHLRFRVVKQGMNS